MNESQIVICVDTCRPDGLKLPSQRSVANNIKQQWSYSKVGRGFCFHQDNNFYAYIQAHALVMSLNFFHLTDLMTKKCYTLFIIRLLVEM